MSHRVLGMKGIGRCGLAAAMLAGMAAGAAHADILVRVEFGPAGTNTLAATPAGQGGVNPNTAIGVDLATETRNTGVATLVDPGTMVAPGTGYASGPTALRVTGANADAWRIDLTGPAIGSVAAHNTIYLSGLFKIDPDTVLNTNKFTSVWLERPTENPNHLNNRPNFGLKWNAPPSEGWFGRTNHNATETTGPNVNPPAGDVAFIVMRLTKTTNPADPAAATTPYNRVDVWVNPVDADLASPPNTTGTFSANAEITGFTKLGVRTANMSGPDGVFVDRIVIATSWSDIVSNDPLFVDLESLSATGRPGMPVTVNWTTSSEIDNAGFHIHRLDATGLTRLTNALIAPLGDEFTGASYSFTDWAAPRGWTTMPQYFLEDVEFSGVSTLHGPAEAIILPAPDSIRVPLQPSAPSLEDPRGGGIKLPVQEEAKVPAASRQSARR